MPSPVESTVPVSATSTCLPYPLICSRRMRLISSARISAMLFCSVTAKGSEGRVLQLFAHALELRAEAAVQHRRANLSHRAADQRRVRLRLQHDRSARHAPDRLAQPLQLVLAERARRGPVCPPAAGLLIAHGVVRAGDGREVSDALAVD